MLRKLKVKFAVTNMILITLVLAIVFAAIYIHTRNSLYTGSFAAMKEAADAYGIDNGFNEKPPSNPKLEKPILTGDRYSHLSLFYVVLDSSKQIKMTVGYSYTLDSDRLKELQNTVDAVLAKNSETGVIRAENMRYYVSKTAKGTKIVFLDKTYESETLRTLVKTFAIVGGISLLIVFLLSWFIAKLSIAPVERSWNRQKQFVADASHELRTPLAVITANAEYLISHQGERSNADDERNCLEYIKDEAERMNTLVNDMLYLAKTDEEQSESVKKQLISVSASDILTESLLSFEPICFERSKVLEQEIEDGCNVLADENTLKQFFAIFLDNALKYSGENGYINVKLFKEREKVVFVIKNSGEKIDEQDIPHLFERFYRTDKSRARTNGGYGLGLSVAKSIADSLGCKITVVSNDKFTSFECKFSSTK